MTKVRKKRKKPKPKNCDHLNLKRTIVGGLEYAVCKDCGKLFSTEEFEEAEPMTEPEAKEKGTKEDGKLVLEVEVPEILVKIPKGENKGKEFYPLFDVKKGDVIRVFRK